MLSLVAPSALTFAPMAPLRASRVAAEPMMMAKSEALPFLEAPPACDGTMAGDVVSAMPPSAAARAAAAAPWPAVPR